MSKQVNIKDYYLGLDLGTNSVGWAVTDTKYNLVKAPVKGKKKNHDMWGIRLFPEADTAAERRLCRCNRRRNRRKVNRIKLLQDLFADEIGKVDPTFFLRLNESRLHVQDKSQNISDFKHPLFIDNETAEKEYYDKYPTIYHLRNDLIHSKEAHDIRLVYLALHHIIKNRGHFLHDGTIGDATNFESAFNAMCEVFEDNDIHIFANKKEVKSILAENNINNTEKKSQLMKVISLDIDDEKLKKPLLTHICIFLAGNMGDVTKLFPDIEDADITLKFKMSDSKYDDEIKPALLSEYSYVVDCLDAIKAVYDWSVLQQIIPDGFNYLSDAKIKAYEKHKINLALLKQLIKYYLGQEQYNKYFRKEIKGNYVSFVGFNDRSGKKYSINKCNEDEFYSYLSKKILSPIKGKVTPDDSLNLLLDKIKNLPLKDKSFEYLDEHNISNIVDLLDLFQLECDKHNLLPIQRSKENGVIPRQIHQKDLLAILDNAKEYLPFLNEIDKEYNITVADKIESIFEYKIPYYVGPLSNKNAKKQTDGTYSHQWMVRKSDGYIYPWNFDDKVDLKASNEKFIRRMTNKCSYLIGEDVLPKNSLLYKKYMVLNELNNLKICSEPISVELKQSIFNDLFLNGKTKKVTLKLLVNYLRVKSGFEDLSTKDISGIDNGFNTNLSSYYDFKNILDHELSDDELTAVEDIIKWITIYDGDSKMIQGSIKDKYSGLFDNGQIKRISKLKYSGWGNFSKKFLTGVFSVVPECNGEELSIIQALYKTNYNLMQLLSSDFSYGKKIDELNLEVSGDFEMFSYDNLVKDLFTSPANKRTIWQALLIVKEIVKVMKYPPKKIFVEMARGSKKGDKGRKDSRKKKLLDLYKACCKDARDWNENFIKNAVSNIDSIDERDFSGKKLYLYYLQNGVSAYSGDPINLDELMTKNSKWDIDHIYPQSRIKDDSFNNLVLVEKKLNAEKSNGVLSRDIQNRMWKIWEYWNEKGFISKDKLHRLKRTTPFTNDELTGFIERQLVETRQSTKIVADVLKKMFNGYDTKIVYVKSAIASQFRDCPLNVRKSRRVNDYHHAKDAYLNIVVGNVYNAKYTDNPRDWFRKNRNTDKGRYSITKTMFFDVYDSVGNKVWEGLDRHLGRDGKKHFDQVDDDYINGQTNLTGGYIDRIRAIVRKDGCLYTEFVWEESGELFNASQERKGSNSATVPLSKDLPIERYGGYKGASTAYFVTVNSYDKKGNKARYVLGVPIHVASQATHDDTAIKNYFEHNGYVDPKIGCKILKNSLLDIDGVKMRIRGENNIVSTFKNGYQPKFDICEQETIRKIEKILDKGIEKISKQYDRIYDKELDDLYKVFEEMLTIGFYKNRMSNQGEKLQYYLPKFLNLSLLDKCIVLNQILNMFRCDVSTVCNLKLIGGGPSVGNIAIRKNTISKNDIHMISQSVTGLFEDYKRI